MADTNQKVEQFFDRYRAALLARDEKAISGMYAVPSLILFPGKSIVVSDVKQTKEFFASSWSQYEGVSKLEKKISIMEETPASAEASADKPYSIWVDVTWSGEAPSERFCYQLIEGSKGYQIAVLTLMMVEERTN